MRGTQRKKAEKQKRRLVSKWRYMGHLGAKAFLRTTGCFLIGSSLVVGLFIFFLILDRLFPEMTNNKATDGASLALILGLVAFSFGFIPVMFFFSRLFKKADAMEPVAPLTRSNIAHLAEPDSLVRPASEPNQPSEEVLLRPVQGVQETPAEQLLRPGVIED